MAPRHNITFNRHLEPTSTELHNFYTLITNKQLRLDDIFDIEEWCKIDTNIYYLIALSAHPNIVPKVNALREPEVNVSLITRGLNDEQIKISKCKTDFLTGTFWHLEVQGDKNPYQEVMDTYNRIQNLYDMQTETYNHNDYKQLTKVLPLNWNEFSYSCRLIGFVYSYLFNQLSPNYQLLKTHYNLRYREWARNYNGDEELKGEYLPPHLVRKLEAMELVMGQSIPTTNDVLVLYLNNDPTWPAYLSMKQIKDVQALEVDGPLSPTTAEALFRHPEKWNETIEQLKAK